MIYEPREDSYLIEKYIGKLCKGKVLDVGCGSGILSLKAMENGCGVSAVDIDEEAVNYCREKGINAKISDLFLEVSGKFDWIVFNPPYLPLDADEDVKSRKITTGGDRGFELIERFFSEAGDYLENDGRVLIVFSSLTGDVEGVMKRYGFKFEILEEKKLFFERLFVVECWKD